MKSFVRTLLVWLVLLAIPFQGFAAAAMTCAHGTHSAPAKHQAKAPCHGDAAKPAAAADDGEPQHKKCGNCAACSVGTAMAPASSTPAPDCCPCNCCPAAAPARVTAGDPDLPERPPRSALA